MASVTNCHKLRGLNHTNMSCGGHKPNMNITSSTLSWVPSEALEENPFPCLSQLPEDTGTPWLVVSSSLSKLHHYNLHFHRYLSPLSHTLPAFPKESLVKTLGPLG